MPTLASPRPPKQRSQLNNVDLVRLSNMFEWAGRILQDDSGGLGVSQNIKDEAYRENTYTPTGTAPRKYPRPFSKIILLQQEKNKRDRNIRERLLREKRLEQQKKEKQGAPYDKAMESARKAKSSKRTSLNPFMRVVRPISTAFPFGGTPTGTLDSVESRKWTLEELNSMPTIKPSLSIDLAGARVEERHNNVRPFIFTLDTEDGVKYYFQATKKREMAIWIAQLSKTGKSTSEKRRTYVGAPATLPNLYKIPENLGRHPTAGEYKRHTPVLFLLLLVFGVPLAFLLEREYGPNVLGIPSFLERCLEEVETRGFSEDGICMFSYFSCVGAKRNGTRSYIWFETPSRPSQSRGQCWYVLLTPWNLC